MLIISTPPASDASKSRLKPVAKALSGIFAAVAEIGRCGILLREYGRHAFGQFPVDAENRIIPSDAPFRTRLIECVRLVLNNRLVLERKKPMPEPARNKEHAGVVSGKVDGEDAQIIGAILSQVHRRILNRAARAADELGLGKFARLKMNAAKRPPAKTQALVVLNEPDRNAESRKCPFIPGFKELSSLILIDGRFYQKQSART